MIRAACISGVVRRATHVLASKNSNRSSSTRVVVQQLRTLSSTSVQHNEENDSSLPSNLTFDHRSSFAPKDRQVLVPPPKADIIPTEEDDDDNKEVDDVDDSEYDDEDDEDIDFTEDLDYEPRYVVPLPDRLKADVRHGLDGSVSGTIWLDPSVFGVDTIRVDLIKQSVDYIRNKIRGRRKAKSKTIGEVSGSGRKVRQQKGSGKARAGHSRPAHWRGGAKAHGPKNTVDYGNVKMNKKTRRLAMASTLSQKLKEGNLIVVDNLLLDSHKTGQWASLLETTYGIGKDGSSALILDHYYEPKEKDQESDGKFHASYKGVAINLWVASGNIYKTKVANTRFANVYDILRKEKLIITLSALEQIESRWKN
jgi:large subunit ribosomal protein L4